MRHERPNTVPYVTARRDEYQERAHKLLFIDGRLCWSDEDPRDRDQQGVLWGRTSHMPPDPETGQPTGTPLFASVHAHRQHEVMSEMWCQVCRRNKASHTAAGWLFLLPAPEAESATNWPEGHPVVHPPLCLPDAHQSLSRCPELRRAHVAVRVRRPRLSGVLGDVYQPTPDGGAERIAPEAPGVLVPYRRDGQPHPHLAYTLASQLVRTLHDCTPVDMATESRAAESRAAEVSR